MRISILTPDISSNCFGRAWLLAKLLQNTYDIEVIGPIFGNEVWKPFANLCDFEVKIVKGHDNGRFELKKMLNMISGDVIFASKPLMTSFGVGLIKKAFSLKPVVLDIDDYEIGFGKELYDSLPWYKKLNDLRLSLTNSRSYYYSLVLNKLTSLADAVTVSGKILQNQYGGTIIWHGRDLRLFNPKNYIKKDFRPLYISEKYREYFVAGFIGTPRPHKGLEDLFDAIKLLRYEHFLLMIVGAHDDAYFMHLRDKIDTLGLRDIVCYLPVQPFEKLPEVLSALDLVIVPQRKRPASYGQVPAKIFDAMAMAKPIVATSVHDIPEILDDCGWLVEPGDPRKLAQTIQYIIDHPNAASEMGRKAREKCKREYSWDIAQERLNKIFAEYVPK